MGSGSLLALVARVHSFRRSTQYIAAGDQVQVGVGSFHKDLAQRVQQLQLQGGSAHLNWLLDACACTLSTHSSLASALKCDLPPTMNERADEVLSMLDACTSLKQVADDVDRQLGLLQAALQGAAGPPNSSCNAQGGRLAAARRLRACLNGLQAISNNQYRPVVEAQAALLLAAKREVAHASHPAAPPLNPALDGTLLISLLLLTSAMATFAPPSKSSSGATRSACKLTAHYTSSRSAAAAAMWAGPLRQLQRDLKQEDMSAVFLEIQGLHASASSIHATVSGPHHIGEVRQSIESLCKRSREAQACVSALRSHLASLFQALLALRLALLAQCC